MSRRVLLLLAVAAMSIALVGSGMFGSDFLRADVGPKKVKPVSASSSGVDSAAALEQLRADLRSLVDLDAEVSSGNVGIYVASPSQDRTIFELNSGKPLTPASTTKLVSSYCAMDALGTHGFITTELAVDRSISDGDVNGNLYLIGHGDPMLKLGQLDGLVTQLKRLGITTIEGDVIADPSYFDDEYERVDYSDDVDEVMALPPVSGLGVEENTFTVVAAGPRTAGVPANVQTFPPSAAFIVKNNATTSSRGGSPSISLELADDGRQIVTVSGRVGTGKTSSKRYEMRNPPMVVAGALYQRLISNGITVRGSYRVGRTPERRKVIAEFARPLGEVLDPVLGASHNYYAEHLFKIVGGEEADGRVGRTSDYARRGIARCMESSRIDFVGAKINDGSGLSRRNLISARTLGELLTRVYDHKPAYEAFRTNLAVAGVSGTLRKRMRGTPAAENVRAKTGTLRNVSALAGYVTTRDGETFAFAMLMNGYGLGQYKRVQDRVAERLAEFSYSEAS